jgi:predicted RNA-binding Zn ribbon-like protein
MPEIKDMEPTPLERDDTPPAPGDLELVRSFLSLHDHRSGVPDSLPPSPSILTRWLREQDLIPPAAEPPENDVRRALEVLEAMREKVFENAGTTAAEPVVRRLNEAAREAGMELRFANGGRTRLEPGASGVRGAIGTLLGIAFLAELDGSWAHLKECENSTCRAVFFDRSKNQSGKWCSMRSCGNRAKVRRFRERRSVTA